MGGWWLGGPNPTTNKFCPLIRGHLMASCPKRAARAHAAHGLTIAQMAELVALGLRASEPRPRFSTIQATPKSGLTLRLVLWPHKFPLPCALASATY